MGGKNRRDRDRRQRRMLEARLKCLELYKKLEEATSPDEIQRIMDELSIWQHLSTRKANHL